ncbi:enteropeptidase-like, partial [Exaiptasia diaphana]|uniref:MAM domain-containing protein n=1 Tax=Exaiptasia diaphana TaxID=2652724 RepID=A0A913YWX3_EXADI
MQNDGWRYYTPTNTSKRYDRSFLEGGAYYIADFGIDRSSTSKFSLQWFKTKPYCMQFWYTVPDKSNSSVKICAEKNNSTSCLWSTVGSYTGEWTYGQVEIPSNLNGTLQIVGNAKKDFLGIDDLNFVESQCSQVIIQSNPSCYFDGGHSCQMKFPKSWVLALHKDQQ